MIEESLRIKLNQFMLAYERQCVELEFQRQNVKQNVMLSILEMKNNKKGSGITVGQLQRSMVKEKGVPNLGSSKQTKFSEDHKEIESRNNHGEEYRGEAEFSEMQRSKLNPTSHSKLLERSNITMKGSKLNNNYMKNEQNFEEFQERAEEPMQKSRKSGMFNNPYYMQKDKQVEVTQMSQEGNDSNMMTFSQRKSVLGKSPKNAENQSIGPLVRSQLKQAYTLEQKLSESSISRSSQRPNNQQQLEKQLQENYSVLAQSMGFQKNSRIYANSQKVIKQNPSIIQKQQDSDHEPEYPTFKRPSFQFVANIEELRQSNPDYQEQQEDQRMMEDPSPQRTGKWNSRPKNTYDQNEPEQDFYNGQLNNQDYEEDEIPTHQENFSHMQEDQSMMMASELNQKPSNLHFEEERKSYFAFEINMDKSSLPSSENIEELKKKKILELERKRLERMENNSKRKQNPSEISSNSKSQKKEHTNALIGNNSRNPSRREHDNRDSLNKSVSKPAPNKHLKTNNMKQEDNGKESAFHDNRTILTKYGDQSRINNRSSSPTPINTVKTTIQTDKRPPLSKNRREENIFAVESNTYQRERSNQKLSADPKIVPMDRKNSFQKKSNLKIMANAITYTCLPGELNRKERQKLIDVLGDYENEFFIFLFKEYSRKVIKGIYILEGNQEKITRIYGDKAPLEVFTEQVHEFYRFDSGSREFKKIDGCKSFSFSIHAIDMK